MQYEPSGQVVNKVWVPPDNIQPEQGYQQPLPQYSALAPFVSPRLVWESCNLRHLGQSRAGLGLFPDAGQPSQNTTATATAVKRLGLGWGYDVKGLSEGD